MSFKVNSVENHITSVEKYVNIIAGMIKGMVTVMLVGCVNQFKNTKSQFPTVAIVT